MKIGIISDTHGKVKRLQRAIGLLKARGAEILVHCGDIGSEECLELLGSSGLPAYAVAGNMDKDLDELRKAAGDSGVTFESGSLAIDLKSGNRLGVTHGDDQAILYQLLVGGKLKYVCHGHTHHSKDEQHGNIRIINPGAIHNPKHPSYPTAALLDETTGLLEFIRIE